MYVLIIIVKSQVSD